MNGMNADATGGTGTPASDPAVSSLAEAAWRIVSAPAPDDKVRLAAAAADLWRERRLSLGARSTRPPMPDRPGRPSRPELLPPSRMPRRSTQGLRGRIALLHSLAHIELNAVDMTWDLVARFVDEPMPLSFFDNWVEVGAEEASHFALVSRRLGELGSALLLGRASRADGTLWRASSADRHRGGSGTTAPCARKPSRLLAAPHPTFGAVWATPARSALG